MIDHTSIHVNADKAAVIVAWYEAALKPLGYTKMLQLGPNGEAVGFGDQPYAIDWWVTAVPGCSNTKSHHAFRAKDRATVDAFYHAAIAAGGECNGKPGVRAESHANYYGAYVRDPAGNNIEAVCHAPPPQQDE